MLHLLDKVLYMAVKAVLSVALALGVLLNPIFDDVISLNQQVAVVRDATLDALPGNVLGRPTQAPRAICPPDEGQKVKVHFVYGDDPVNFTIRVTPADLRYDTDISSAWAGSNYERNRRVSLYVREYAETPMIADFASHLRKTRSKLGLDREQYAALIVTMVQRMQYDSPAGTYMRAPVRVVLDGAGDCDERAFLAAAILAHEGFDSAIFEFDREQHAALGLRTHAASPFPGTDYAFCEMTEDMPIGDWAAVATASGPDTELVSAPLVIPISSELHASR